MSRYECCFLYENDKVVRIEVLGSCDDGDAHRQAMTLMARIGRFSGLELWEEGRKVDSYKPAKAGAAPLADRHRAAELVGEVEHVGR
jgi:hypothetical protein